MRPAVSVYCIFFFIHTTILEKTTLCRPLQAKPRASWTLSAIAWRCLTGCRRSTAWRRSGGREAAWARCWSDDRFPLTVSPTFSNPPIFSRRTGPSGKKKFKKCNFSIFRKRASQKEMILARRVHACKHSKRGKLKMIVLITQ